MQEMRYICLRKGNSEEWSLLNWVELNFEFSRLRTSCFNSWVLIHVSAVGSENLRNTQKFNSVANVVYKLGNGNN